MAQTLRQDDLFAATSYFDWASGVLRLRGRVPDLAILFDSTIQEPTEALVELTRDAFSPPVTSRYVSVFTDGNPYAVRALGRRYGLGADQIITTTGATGSLALVLKALVRPGDQVLVERPGFDIHPRMIADAGAEAVPLARPAPDFRVDLEDLRAKLSPRVRAVLLTNLHNPSGVRLSAPEIAAVADLLAPFGAILIVDEVYGEFAGRPGAHPTALIAPNIVTISSLTKVFGLFALKFGWLAAQAELIARIKAAVPDGDIGVSKLSHAVAAHVLEAPEAFEAHWRRTLAATRPIVLRAAEQMRDAGLIAGEPPPFGCMYFPRVVGVDDTLSLARRLYEDHRVIVAPGEYFGLPGHLRIGYGAETPDLEIGLRRLAEGLAANR